jgi:hypothetical protein
MSLNDIITLLGFGFGFALTIILLSLSLQKKSKRYDDYAFGVVLIAVLFWNGGNFLSLLLTWLFGSVAESISLAILGLGYLGLVAMPSSTLHVHLAIYFRSIQPDIKLSRKNRLALFLCYSPLALFLPIAISSIQLNNPPSYGIGSGIAQLLSPYILKAAALFACQAGQPVRHLLPVFSLLFHRPF